MSEAAAFKPPWMERTSGLTRKDLLPFSKDFAFTDDFFHVADIKQASGADAAIPELRAASSVIAAASEALSLATQAIASTLMLDACRRALVLYESTETWKAFANTNRADD